MKKRMVSVLLIIFATDEFSQQAFNPKTAMLASRVPERKKGRYPKRPLL